MGAAPSSSWLTSARTYATATTTNNEKQHVPEILEQAQRQDGEDSEESDDGLTIDERSARDARGLHTYDNHGREGVRVLLNISQLCGEKAHAKGASSVAATRESKAPTKPVQHRSNKHVRTSLTRAPQVHFIHFSYLDHFRNSVSDNYKVRARSPERQDHDEQAEDVDARVPEDVRHQLFVVEAAGLLADGDEHVCRPVRQEGGQAHHERPGPQSALPCCVAFGRVGFADWEGGRLSFFV